MVSGPNIGDVMFGGVFPSARSSRHHWLPAAARRTWERTAVRSPAFCSTQNRPVPSPSVVAWESSLFCPALTYMTGVRPVQSWGVASSASKTVRPTVTSLFCGTVICMSVATSSSWLSFQSADGDCACQSAGGEGPVEDGRCGVHRSGGYRGDGDGGAQDGRDEGFVAGQRRGRERCCGGEDRGGGGAAPAEGQGSEHRGR